jgi:PPOX class probable F420-dependent enzyme
MATSEQVQKVRRLASADHGLAVVATQRGDGSIQASVVNAGVIEHPTSGKPAVALVAQGDSMKLKNLRRSPRATVVFRAGWQWVSVEGPASLVGPKDRLDGVESSEVARLLREIFTAAGGTHDNWEEYDRVMAAEGRTAVYVEMRRVTG